MSLRKSLFGFGFYQKKLIFEIIKICQQNHQEFKFYENKLVFCKKASKSEIWAWKLKEGRYNIYEYKYWTLSRKSS